MPEHECKRCGKCCKGIGRTFFIHTDHPLIKALHHLEWDDKGTCNMLLIEPSGTAVCLIQRYLGDEAKPEVCQDYPSDGKCERQK